MSRRRCRPAAPIRVCSRPWRKAPRMRASRCESWTLLPSFSVGGADRHAGNLIKSRMFEQDRASFGVTACRRGELAKKWRQKFPQSAFSKLEFPKKQGDSFLWTRAGECPSALVRVILLDTISCTQERTP